VIRRLSPEQTSNGVAVLMDVREYPEYAAAAIPGSVLVSLSKIDERACAWKKDDAIVFVCRSGRRAAVAALKFQEMGFSNLAILAGGIEAWQKAGLAVQVADRKPWSIERQVRILAGSMIVVSTALGLTISPWFFGWALFVGAGLTFAGISDICLMATLLGRLPWNRQNEPKGPGVAACR
jgi:rhodanese-related sulfurtransferase